MRCIGLALGISADIETTNTSEPKYEMRNLIRTKICCTSVKVQMRLATLWKDAYVLLLICITYVDADFICFATFADYVW